MGRLKKGRKKRKREKEKKRSKTLIYVNMAYSPFGDDSKKELKNTRSQRKLCWDSRDKYFECLNSINVINALSEKNQPLIKKSCQQQEDEFEKNCVDSWIRYFKEKRVDDYRKEQLKLQMEQQEREQMDLVQRK